MARRSRRGRLPHAGVAGSKTGATVDLVAFEEAAARLGSPAIAPRSRKRRSSAQGDLLPEVARRNGLTRTGSGCGSGRSENCWRRLVGRLEQERAFGEAIEHAQQLCRLDPLDEPVWCALMRCHARRGERATALHLYQQCAAVLKKELGIQPSAGTRITYREILELDAETPALSPPPRTAVYPLVGRHE